MKNTNSFNAPVHSCLHILDFNCKNILTCEPFFKEIEDKVDICLLQEHWLYDCQLHKLNEVNTKFFGTGKAVDTNDPIPPYQMPRGYGGTAILWKKEIDSLVTPLAIGSNRIQGIELQGKPNLIILSVYMPCKGTIDHVSEFKNCIDQIHEILSTYKNCNQVIIGGDLNEDIVNGKASDRKNSVQELMSENDLSTKHLGATFINSYGQDSTTIDFFLYQKEYEKSVVSIEKLDIIGNVSDHYPLLLKLNVSLGTTEMDNNQSKTTISKIRWEKVDILKYKQNIQCGLEKLNFEIDSEEDLSTVLQNINNIIKVSAEVATPGCLRPRKKPKLKVMNDAIRNAITQKKRAFHNWKANGRTRDPNNLYMKAKKETTQLLRKECRLEIANRRIVERQRLIQVRSTDKNMLFKLIRKQRGQLTRHIDSLTVDDTTYSNNEILQGWRKHFLKLAEKSNSEQYNQEYIREIEKEVQYILELCESNLEHQPISDEEFMTAIKSLNRNKAADTYGITAENIVFGGNYLHSAIQNLLNKMFEWGKVLDNLKTGLVFPVYKNKGNLTDSRFYRGITVTPIYSKIIEKVIKNRENPKIMEQQSPLQRGFTEQSSPLLCDLFIEEFQRESKELNIPTYIAFLDSKSAFDVVIHANLVRRLFQMGLSNQSIVLINSLYSNATSCIKWNGQLSENFRIEQGVRQGGAFSADLYKIYINPLLKFLEQTGLGGHIGNINCCAPTCADDVALISNNPLELQILINIVANYSKNEGYTLQPAKSVILPIKSNKTVDMGNEFWNINGNNMPVVTNTTHIGIHKCEKDSARSTVEENIKRARRTTYSLMGSGFHGKNGLDPETILTLFITYILPMLTYGLEVLLPTGKNLENLQSYYKKLIKQLLTLPTNIGNPAIYILSGLLPIEAVIELQALSMFGNITRSDRNSVEWRLAERQLAIKDHNSKSWFIEIKKICIKYEITDCQQYIFTPLMKSEWKTMTKKKVYQYWNRLVNEESKSYPSLKWIMNCYKIGIVHPILRTKTASVVDIARIPLQVKIATGTYLLQVNRAKFNNKETSNCKLCDQAVEDISHFILSCPKLMTDRNELIKNITNQAATLCQRYHINIELDILNLIANPFYIVKHSENRTIKVVQQFIDENIEPACRALVYKLHYGRYKYLEKMQSKPDRK